jgi:hypothetical protein
MADNAQPMRKRLPPEFATAKKRDEIGRLLEAYRGAYVRSLWQVPGLRCIACDHKGDADFIGARNV